MSETQPTAFETMLHEAELAATHLQATGEMIDEGDPKAGDRRQPLTVMDQPVIALLEDISFGEVAALLRRQSEAMKTMAEALRSIRDGSSDEGRWLSFENDEECGTDKDKPDEGYYDQTDPPAGYNDEGWIESEFMLAPEEPLMPAYWEAYSQEEQNLWVGSCESIAAMALTGVGFQGEAG